MIGINLGSGRNEYGPWKLAKWRGLDKIGGHRLDSKSVFPFRNNSLKCVYSSHFFEHIDDQTARNLIDESRRVLCTGGILRIVVPNFAMFIERYLANDEEWFRKINNGRPEWRRYGVQNTLSNLLLHWVANFDYKGPKGFYRGPPMQVSSEDVKEHARLGTQHFCEWAQSLVPEDASPQHINWWDLVKFREFLSDFTAVYRSKCNQSRAGAMRGSMFDLWKPQRRKFSLYVEASV